jgi:geranylgeranyl diphosphate synthase type I
LALIWASKMLHQSGIKSADLIRALPVYDEMRVELMAGQYLDVYEQALATQSVERAMRVARYKSAKYTIERPLHFGAQLGSVTSKNIESLNAKYSDYGLPLGEAFQLRDDVLGVFGDPIETGKPAGDDLREGKRTVLMAATIERATDSAKLKIEKLFADPDLDEDGVAILRSIIVESGALNQLEDLIESLTIAALTATRSELIDPIAQTLLHELVAVAIARRV